MTATDDLVPTLEQAFTAGGVHVVAVPIDYSENTRVLIEELHNPAPELDDLFGASLCQHQISAVASSNQ